MLHDSSDRQTRPDDISAEAIAATKRRSRINAVTLGLVFLVSALAPPRWKIFAPFLFLLPVVLSLLGRLRSTSVESSPPVATKIEPPGPVAEPYSYTPRDPNDPRRYKPIE